MSFSIQQPVSGNYLFLPVIHPELKELFKGVSSNAGSNPDSIEKATEINDVGINFATFSEEDPFVQMVQDESRHNLYTRSEKGSINSTE
jgi:hypothetical protein